MRATRRVTDGDIKVLVWFRILVVDESYLDTLRSLAVFENDDAARRFEVLSFNRSATVGAVLDRDFAGRTARAR